MKIQIDATEQELKEKSIPLIKSIADYVGEVDIALKDKLIKAIEDKDPTFSDPVLLEVLKQWELSYKDHTDLMLKDIGKVLNRGKLNKSMGGGWIGVDFDGTLATYTGYHGPSALGKPIPKMLNRVKGWISAGKNVKIMTARANPSSGNASESISAIKKWCRQYIGKELDVVYKKDSHMEELWDDKAIHVQKNTGNIIKSDEGISYFHFDKSLNQYVEDYEELNKAQRGPFIGPRGGKWADPEHTIPWKEEEHSVSETKERYSDEEAEQKLNEIGEKLYSHQAINLREKDDTGFNYVDMGRWNSVSGINSKRQLLQKYKRQIVGAYGIEEYHKLGLADTREGKGFKADIKPYYNKTWGSLMLPVDGRVDRDTFNKYREINKKYNVWFSNGDNFVKEQYLDDFDFDKYKKELGEIGINVHPIKGERKEKVSEKEEKDLTTDEALDRIKNRTIKDAIVFKRTGPDTFDFWSTYSEKFNKLFKNKTPMISAENRSPDDHLYNVLSGIFEYKKDNYHARETKDLDVAEEALEAIQKYLPEYKLYIDEKGLKEAQDERARYEAELQKPIPGVQSKLDPKYSLFPYQNEGVRFLDKTGGNALIGDEMGLGKTLETLAWVAKGDHRTILVVPKVVRRTWLQEAEKFFPGHFKGAELVSADIRNNRIPNLKDKNIVTVNYESLDKFYPYLKEAGFDTVVVDESHRMKNPKAKQTKAIQKVGQLPSIKHHILLSGTAIKNKKEELFTQLQLVVPGKFQSKGQIKFATIGGLWHQMKEFYIARTKKKVLKDLPEKVTSIIQQEIPGLPDYGASKDIGDVARLKAKIAIGKVPATIDLAKEILDSSDSKIIVFTDSVEAANKVYDELGHDVSLLHHGQMSDGKREEVKSEFQRTNEQGDFISPKRVFVTTRQSMAVGATLTAADKVIFNDLPWTAADVTQAEDRAHRIGQKNNVNVYWVTAENNQFDSSVSDIVKTKYELSKKMNQGKKLSADEVNWMNKPVTVSDILNKIHGGKTPIEAVKELPIKETKVDAPVIPIEATKQEEERPAFYIKDYVNPPKVFTIQSVIPDSQLDPREIIQRIKSYGKDRKESYALYDKVRGDKKELNEKDFNFVMDHVDANSFSKPREIKFKPTHTDVNNVVEVMVTERTPMVVHYIDATGRYGSASAFDFDKKYNTLKEEKKVGEPVPLKEEPKFVIQEPEKNKRGRPPGSKNIQRTPMLELPVTEKKKRGRPPGSKNIVRTPMQGPIPQKVIERTPMQEKPGRGRPPKPENVKTSENSLSTVSAKGIKLKKIGSDEIHNIYHTNLAIDSDDAKITMNELRSKGINVTILEGNPGIVKIRKGFSLSEQDLLKALFIGPQGGRWSDAAHTIPYKETSERTIKKESPGSQLPLPIQNKLKELRVDKLPQASIPVSEIKTDFSGDIDSKAIITWKDTKGKIQSGYTPKFHEMNAKKKWDRIMKFRDKKDGVVRSLNGKLQKEEKGSIDHQGYTILAIIAETGLRPGSISSVQKHGHYGISTLKKEHIAINDKMAVLNFIGKEGKKNVTVVKNLVTLKALQYYIDNSVEGDSLFNPNSLDKVKDILPKGMKVKDLRTIKATESAERFLKQVDTPPPLTGDIKKDKRLLAKALLETSKKVATILNNTPSIAKASYIHPRVFEQWARNVGAKDSLWKDVGNV